MGWPTLWTDRLELRPLTMDDLDALAPLHAQESFWRFPFGRGFSKDETQTFLEQTVQRYDDPGPAVSAVVLRAGNELAGWAGLSVPTFLPEILPAVELGFRLGEQHWGKGLATEAGAAWVRYAFEELGLTSIVSISEPANAASAAVARALGFSVERETTHPERGLPLLVMALAPDSWRPA